MVIKKRKKLMKKKKKSPKNEIIVLLEKLIERIESLNVSIRATDILVELQEHRLQIIEKQLNGPE